MVELESGRLDVYLTKLLPDLSRSRVQGLVKEGLVTVNDGPTRVAYQVEGGDRVRIEIPPPASTELIPEDVPVDVIYEDEDVAVINKASGMTVHPSPTQRDGTLVHALLSRLTGLSGIGGELRPGIVHRLDKDTSGLVIVAKHDRAHEFLAKQFETRTAKKHYVALVVGRPKMDSGEWTTPIIRHPTERQRFTSKTGEGREARSAFKVEERFLGSARLEVELFTGRTHQIRVHASDHGFPLVGDRLYGGRKRAGQVRNLREKALLCEFPRQALHAESLRIRLPSGLDREFRAPWPNDLSQLVVGLRALSSPSHEQPVTNNKTQKQNDAKDE